MGWNFFASMTLFVDRFVAVVDCVVVAVAVGAVAVVG